MNAIVQSDKARVEMLRDHAKAHKLPNLRMWCMVWLDPASAAAKEAAEAWLRKWVEQGDPSKDGI